MCRIANLSTLYGSRARYELAAGQDPGHSLVLYEEMTRRALSYTPTSVSDQRKLGEVPHLRAV